MTSKWISADSIINKLNSNTGFTTCADVERAIKLIQDEPSVDIVRCKECRYCKKKRGAFKGEPIIFYRCEENNRDVENDDYCFWGERKGDE